MASLLKVPLAVAYFRLAEITPDVLSQKVVYSGIPDLYLNQNIQPPEKLIKGKEYTIEDLLYRSLAYSDNTAAEILSQNYVTDDYLQKILLTIGLHNRNKDQIETMVTAKSYAGVFRILYNSSFLTRKYSNEIIKTLSQSSFTDGATANLPAGVFVAHKFGERAFIDPQTKSSTIEQLHDCGIVYAKDRKEPYTFCILTEGKSFFDLKTIIQQISATIYKGIVE